MEYGSVNIKLKELIERKGISKYKLCNQAQMQLRQVNNYCNNNITRLDIDVLARLCTVFECSMNDLLEFVSPE